MKVPPLSRSASNEVIEATSDAIQEGLAILVKESKRTGMLAVANCEAGSADAACLMIAGTNAREVMRVVLATLDDACHAQCETAGCTHPVCSNCGSIREDDSSPICGPCARQARRETTLPGPGRDG